MKMVDIQESIQRMAESCCATEQLERYVRGTLKPLQTEWLETHLESGCAICRARLALLEHDSLRAPAEQKTAGLWKELAVGVLRLLEPISLTVSEAGLQIHRGLEHLNMAKTLDAGDKCSGGVAEIKLGGRDAVEVRVKWLTADKILVQVNALEPMRTKVTVHERDENEQTGRRHARLFLNPTLELELGTGAWILRVHQDELDEIREILVEVLSADPT
jgi:hypothetical protein